MCVPLFLYFLLPTYFLSCYVYDLSSIYACVFYNRTTSLSVLFPTDLPLPFYIYNYFYVSIALTILFNIYDQPSYVVQRMAVLVAAMFVCF